MIMNGHICRREKDQSGSKGAKSERSRTDDELLGPLLPGPPPLIHTFLDGRKADEGRASESSEELWGDVGEAACSTGDVRALAGVSVIEHLQGQASKFKTPVRYCRAEYPRRVSLAMVPETKKSERKHHRGLVLVAHHEQAVQSRERRPQ